ncbi:MAG: MucR family transcriptional regulator [Desulfobaccales bacterium]
MASENLKLTAQIVMSHASMRKLTPQELVTVIKRLYATLASLEAEDVVPEPKPKVIRQRKPRKVKIKGTPEAKAVENEEGLTVGDPDYMEFMESREG